MPRRSIWDDEEKQTESAADQSQTAQPPSFTPPPPTSILDSLRAEPPKRRDRSWDNARTHLVATYRGIPIEVQSTVKEIAADLEVTTGEVARALFEYALRSVAQDQLRLQARPKGVRMTLYGPTGGKEDEPQTRTWPQAKGSAKRRREKEPPRGWQRVVSYHGIPPEVQQEIKRIADRHTVPVGEVATLLLNFGLDALMRGDLRLTAHPKIVSSLEWDQQEDAAE